MQLLNLKAIPHPDGNRIDLSWEFPEQAVGMKIRVVRREDRYPRLEDGEQSFDDDRFLVVAENANLRTASDAESLQAEHVYYYAIMMRTDGESAYSLDPANRIAAMATGPFDMAGQMYDLLPGIYKRYDTSDADPQSGPLRRFLSLPGGQLDQLYSFARAMRLLRDPERVDGRLLPLLAQWIGWRTDFRRDFQAQRNELRQAPYIQDTVGTLPNIEATVKRLIGWDCRAKEFVNNIFVTNQPQRLNLWVMRLNGQAEPDPAELLSLDFAYEGRPSAIVSNDIGGSTRRWLFYHSPLSSGVESTCPVPPQSGWTILYKTMLTFQISKTDFAPVLGRNSISTALLQQFADHGLALSYDLALEAMGAATGSWLITDNQRHAKYKVEEEGEDLVVSTEWSGGLLLIQEQDKRWRRHPSAVTFGDVPLVFWDVYDSATANWFIEASKYENGLWTPPWKVFDDSQNATDRRSPHAVVHDGNVWLFWQERFETGWRLRYLKTPTIADIEKQKHEDFPDIQPGQPVDPEVEDDFFAVSDPVNTTWLRFFLGWARQPEFNARPAFTSDTLASVSANS